MGWRDHTEFSKNQKKFCQDMEDQGWTEYLRLSYSGRGMYGRTCPGIVTRAHSDWDSFDADDVVRATRVKLSRDSMGKETILYCAS